MVVFGDKVTFTPMPQAISLRDYFAAQYLASPLAMGEWEGGGEPQVARTAYKIADAMLKEREKVDGR